MTMHNFLLITLMIFVAYLCGSLPFAVIVSNKMKLRNPLNYGSHNPGATNMLRLNGKFPASLVLFLDMLKGLVPVYLSYRLGIPPFYLGLIAISTCLGHIFPCFSHFKGGKGVATALGTMLMIGFDFSGCILSTWILFALLSGYSSIGAIGCFLFSPLFVWFIKPEMTMPVSMLSCLIIVRHSSNIQRLLKGKEKKIFRKYEK